MQKMWLEKLRIMEDELAHRYSQWRTTDDDKLRQNDSPREQAVPFKSSRTPKETKQGNTSGQKEEP